MAQQQGPAALVTSALSDSQRAKLDIAKHEASPWDVAVAKWMGGPDATVRDMLVDLPGNTAKTAKSFWPKGTEEELDDEVAAVPWRSKFDAAQDIAKRHRVVFFTNPHNAIDWLHVFVNEEQWGFVPVFILQNSASGVLTPMIRFNKEAALALDLEPQHEAGWLIRDMVLETSKPRVAGDVLKNKKGQMLSFDYVDGGEDNPVIKAYLKEALPILEHVKLYDDELSAAKKAWIESRNFPYHCDYCKHRHFKDKKGKEIHVTKAHPEKDRPTTKFDTESKRCLDCVAAGKYSPAFSTYPNFLTRHWNPFHVEKHDRKYKCLLGGCIHSYDGEKGLKRHRRDGHTAPALTPADVQAARQKVPVAQAEEAHPVRQQGVTLKRKRGRFAVVSDSESDEAESDEAESEWEADWVSDADEPKIVVPGVLDCTIVAVPHRVLGEEPAAVVVPKPSHPDLKPAELTEFLRTRLAPFKIPVFYHMLASTDEIPRNPNGKVQKGIYKKEVEQLWEAEQAKKGPKSKL
ncbi:hypothetical protein DFJ74DRAFT_767370 [Hyaloraphidium curvatum]|nr:hypothetical protein DFJ74DRAFT_767370 [Hyaloraphidium curvatum]